MRILAAAFAFNEEPYLPAWEKYYRNQGCEMLVMDNYSDDNTHKWCGDHGIHTGRVDTNGTFALQVLQKALQEEILKIAPDWVIYTGIDLFQVFPNGIRKTIELADSIGCNLIEVDHYEAMNTGEEKHLPLSANYFYMHRQGKRLRMICKLVDGFNLIADEIKVDDPQIFYSRGILVNYGMCKPREARELTYARRRKAWEAGTHKGWGTHYPVAQSRNWIWDKESLIDIRTDPFIYSMIQQTQL